MCHSNCCVVEQTEIVMVGILRVCIVCRVVIVGLYVSLVVIAKDVKAHVSILLGAMLREVGYVTLG